MPSPSFRVGGDADAWCTRCKMVLGHTVLAMVSGKPARARCNTCQGEHTYRPGPPGTSTSRASSASVRAEPRARPQVTSFEALVAAKDPSRARRYSAKERFLAEELIEHPTFGLGIVREVRGDKIEVLFKIDTKTLVHAKA